ncbi:MAG: tetratricopeptide repeat protein [Planctomycetota bacterium]
MPRRYFNWKLIIVLVIGLGVLGITAYGLRQWQRNQRADRGLVLGNKAYDEHNWEEAAKNLGRYLAVTQDDVPVLLKYADAQLNIRPLKRGNIQQAMSSYRIILRNDENNATAVEKLVGLYLQMNIAAEAQFIAERYLQTYKNPKVRRMLAISLVKQRKFREAATQLQTIIEEDPEQILAYETLGQLTRYYPEHFPATAEHWFNEAIKNNPSSAQAFIIRAAFHLINNDNAKAMDDLEQAEKHDLSDPLIRLRLATEFTKANALDKARTHLAKVQAQIPTNQALWESWAILALKTTSEEEMLKVALEGLKELGPQPWDFMPIAAELFIRCGEFNRARDCIDKLKQKNIASAAVAFLQGLLAEAKQQNHEAIRFWLRAKQLGYNSQKTQLALGKAYSRVGDNQSAIRQLRTLVSEQPYLFQGHLGLARLLSQTGNWGEAAEQARLAMQVAPNNPNATLLYIQAQMRLIESNSTASNEQIWHQVEKQLTELENLTSGAFEVKLLRLQLAMQREDFKGAEQLLTNLKSDNPSRIELLLAEVELLKAQDAIEQAITKLHILTEQFPQNVLPVRHLATLWARHGNRENCEEVLKDAILRIESPEAKRELGSLLVRFYTQWQENDKSYQLLMALSQEIPDDIPIKRQLLRFNRVIKDKTLAQQLVNNIRALEGDDGWQWRYEQAKIYFAAENFNSLYPQIVSLLKETLHAQPDDQTSRMLLAATYEKAGNIELAVAMYRETLNRSPEDIRIIVPTVAALYKAKDYDQADEILNRAARQKLTNLELSKLEFQSYLRRGELDPASDILEKMLLDDPNNQAVCLSLVLLKMRQNNFTEAGELLTKLKIQAPNSLPITVAQIELNVRQGKSSEAMLLCDEIVSKFNNAPAYILRARTFAMLGQAERAKKDFEHATTIEPNNAEAWTAKSDFYHSIAQTDIAIIDIRKAISVAPDNLAVQKRAISLFLASIDPDTIHEGKKILDKALTSDPEDIELRLYKARSLLAEGTAPAIKQATSILQKITEDQPNLSSAWALLAEIALRQGQSLKAIDIALQGLVHWPNDKSLLLLKARSEAARSPALAIPTLKALRELDPNDVDAVVHLANTYLAADQPQKAANLLKKQLISRSGSPDERKINMALAVALHKSGDKPKSQEIFDSLNQSAPDDPSPLLAQAQLLKDDKLWNQLNQKAINWCQNHPEDTYTPITIASDLAATESNQAKKTAEYLLRGILDRDPNSLPAMNMLAMLLHLTGRSAESTTLYQQILTLQPDNLVAINNLAWILCEEHGKYQQALELAQRGLRTAPNYTDLIDTRGVVYCKLGQYNKALQDFTKCLELYPDGTPSAVVSYLHLGRALVGLGQKDEAIESLKKTLELNIKIGGLSATDSAEARRLLEELSQGG